MRLCTALPRQLRRTITPNTASSSSSSSRSVRRLSAMADQLLVASGNGTAPPPETEAAESQQTNTTTTTTTTTTPPSSSSGGRHTLASLPKSWRFTSQLPPDPVVPTPAASHRTPRDAITPRQVRGGLFTWVRPEAQRDPELLAVSPAALRDLDIAAAEAATDAFRHFAVGNVLLGWDDEKLEGGYPWAQLYGGFQFGQWAGQLGDGRAISLFETTSPRSADPITGRTPTRHELQLKGAGRTPYSRFADGKAVLRSSIREFVVSEALHALGVPTTRALALSLLPHARVLRESGPEPGAVVVRFAPSWLRLGNFDLLRARGDRPMIRRLATFVAEDVFGGWATLPARLRDPADPASSPADLLNPHHHHHQPAADELQGPPDAAENRFARLYREVVRRSALLVAKWQAYGFMNGVLNTDNTSIYGLSIDFGPFAFMDDFDPAYTPNHDDHALRYSYRNQPTIIWWNLVRFGEALGELIGAGAAVDDARFIDEGVADEAAAAELVARAEKLITQAGDEYKALFLAEYKRLMTARLGLRRFRDADFDSLYSELLDTMEALQLDFNHFFRRLSAVRVVDDLATDAARKDRAAVFFHREGVSAVGVSEDEARARVAAWLDKWRARVIEDWGAADGTLARETDAERTAAMKKVNPNFVPRSFVLDEIIKRVEKDGERDVLRRVMHMALHPFEDAWDGQEFQGSLYSGDKEEEIRWTGDVPKFERAMQCSCSS